MDKIAEIMGKILEILIPLNDIVVERLRYEDATVAQEWRCELSGDKIIPFASCLHSVLFNVPDSIAQKNSPLRYYSNERERQRIMRIMEKAGTPLAHLAMLRRYFEYLSERRGDTDWKTHLTTIDRMIQEMKGTQDTIAYQDIGKVKVDAVNTMHRQKEPVLIAD